MTITYSVNGTTIHGVQSIWERVPTSANDDGTIDYSPFALNHWTMPQLAMSLFETMRASQGTALSSLGTNDIDSRNSGKSYGTVFVEGVIGGEQRGIVMRDVRLSFRVDVS